MALKSTVQELLVLSGQPKYRKTFSIPLKELDPERISSDDLQVNFYVKEERKKILVVEADEENRYFSSYYFRAKSTDSARRVAKAMKHLSKECGATGELFSYILRKF